MYAQSIIYSFVNAAGMIILFIFSQTYSSGPQVCNSTDWWTDLIITELTYIENLFPELHHGITHSFTDSRMQLIFIYNMVNINSKL